MAYSIDFIKRAVAYRQEGHTLEQLREAFNIPSAIFYDWEEKLNNGYFDVIIKRERHRKIGKEALKQAVAENLTLSLRNMRNNSILRQLPSTTPLKNSI